MKALVFSKLTDAQAQQAKVDASLGYPKAGVDIGEGVHAPASQSVTTTWARPVQQDDGTWAYPVDTTVEALLAPTELAAVTAIAEPVTLDGPSVDVAFVDSPQPK